MGDVTVLRDPILGEEVVRRVFPSGLTVYVIRKPEFARSYATMATRYGSVDTRLPGDGRGRSLPDGIAHFLEHKVFETPEGPAHETFASQGAWTNAYTSFSRTSYLFGTTREFARNLRTLLEMVFELHVTEENVEKEKGIIAQEIAMFDDDPGWRLFHGALGALYRRHPVRIDIGGTVESIQKITPELLREVHRAFYHPSLMTLAVVSSAPPSVTHRVVEECVESRRFGPRPKRLRPFPVETRRVARREVQARLRVARPRFMMAFKDRAPGRPGKPLLRRELVSALGLDCLFGNSGSIYLRLYEQGLLDDTFVSRYTTGPGYAFAALGGETDDVPRLKRALERELRAELDRGIGRDDFERIRNRLVGDYARSFNSAERIAHMLVAHHYRGTVLQDYRDLLGRVRLAELNRRTRELLDPAARTYSVVLPR